MRNIFNIVFCSLFACSISAQSIDRVEAVIGNEVVFTSDIESQYLQFLSQGNERSYELRCEVIEDLLFQKLLVNQAKLDSVELSDDVIVAEIQKRIDYFERQLGNIEKVEEYFGKSKIEIEVELGKVIKDQFLAQKVQSSIVSNIKVTPAEVRSFLNSQNTFDIPEVPAKVEISQIIIKPEIPEEEKDKLRQRLNSFRERTYKGENFKMLATLYSDDPGSASKGGELGFVNRGDLVPEFERAAFRLKEGEISEVVESQFGFHIVQLIKRRGDQINVRHILLKPKVTSTSLYEAKLRAEAVEREIKDGKITFEDAVVKYSNDESKNNGGLFINTKTMSTFHVVEEMIGQLRYTVEQLSVDSVSSPVVIRMHDDKQAYCILKINKRIESHTANLVDDFSMIKDFAVNSKKQNVLLIWMKKTINKTYIKIDDDILECSFKNKWVK